MERENNSEEKFVIVLMNLKLFVYFWNNKYKEISPPENNHVGALNVTQNLLNLSINTGTNR